MDTLQFYLILIICVLLYSYLLNIYYDKENINKKFITLNSIIVICIVYLIINLSKNLDETFVPIVIPAF